MVFPADTGIAPFYVVYNADNRYKSGVVTGKGKDVIWADGYWLGEAANSGEGQYIPISIADKLRGREFRDFDAFRKVFWIDVSKNEQLISQLNESNQSTIKNGRAPFCRKGERVGRRVKYEKHHVDEIQHGGEVYNIDNLKIITPKNHIGIHSIR